MWKHTVGTQQELDGFLLIACCPGTLLGHILRKIRRESLTLSLVCYVTSCKLLKPFGLSFFIL